MMKQKEIGSFTVARKIVENWIENQLRKEGREGIYIDDEAALIIDIDQLILEEREACAKIAEDYSIDGNRRSIAQAIRARGGK